MQNKKLFILFLITALLINTSCKKDEDVVSFDNNWDEDVYVFGNNLKTRHKNLFHNISEAKFNEDIKLLRSKTNTLSDAEINIELFKIINKISDSHTSIMGGSWFTTLPFSVEWLSDGMIITGINEENSQYLGKKIVAICGIDIETIIDHFSTLIAYENESCLRWFITSYLRVPEIYNHFGISESENSITLNLEGGVNIELFSMEEELVSIYTGVSLPLYMSNTSDYYWYSALNNEEFLYIQYNRAKERNDLSFQTFTTQISELINQSNTISKIIIDLRLNSGGNSLIAKPLIELLHYYVNHSILLPENIYVIIGRKTFSSAVLNSIELMEAFNPIFIGEPSGGKPNHFGEVERFTLPNSKLRVSYSTKYFNWLQDDPSSIIPNTIIEVSSEDLLQGIDPVLDYILIQ